MNPVVVLLLDEKLELINRNTTLVVENDNLKKLLQQHADDGYIPACAVCGGFFTANEWDDRHSTAEGEDCHAKCCDCQKEEL